MEWIFKLLALILAVVPHEVAHGYIAWKLGDPTAQRARRLTLNPLAHLDPIGSVVLPALLLLTGSPVLFGWAKPVPFNPGYFRDPRRGMMLVGVAGPATNLGLAIAAAVLFRLLGSASAILGVFLVYLCVTNIVLGVFNLIPIPPLDGSRVALGLLPPSLAAAYLRLEPFGFLIVFGLLWLGALDRIIHPASSFLLRLLLNA